MWECVGVCLVSGGLFFFLIHNFGFCILQVLFRGMVSALYARLYVGFWHE